MHCFTNIVSFHFSLLKVKTLQLSLSTHTQSPSSIHVHTTMLLHLPDINPLPHPLSLPPSLPPPLSLSPSPSFSVSFSPLIVHILHHYYITSPPVQQHPLGGPGAMLYPGKGSAWQPVVTSLPSMVDIPKESIIANTDFTTTSVIAKR